MSEYTGIVAWMDGYGTLHKNESELGKASKFQITRYTGDVIWADSYGSLHKNSEEFGRMTRFAVADRTGDVAWTDSYNNLYKNRTLVTSSFESFRLREDGRLIWRDNSGHEHYQ